MNRELPVPFYNWLNERDDRTQINSRPNLENCWDGGEGNIRYGRTKTNDYV